MRFLDAVAARLARPDMVQGLVLLFVTMAFVLAVRWPTGISLVNEAWFSLAPVRSTALALGALAYGAVLGARPRPRHVHDSDTSAAPTVAFGTPEWHREAGVTLAALAVMAVVTAPFEVASHAASFPGTGVGWSLVVPFLALSGYFGVGLLLGRASALASVTAALPLLVPAVMAGGAWLDVSAGSTVVNPWTATLSFSPTFVVVLGAFALIGLWAVLPRRAAASGEDAVAGAGS